MKLRHFVDLKDFDAGELNEVIDLAGQMKADSVRFSGALGRKKLYLLFEKTSTRTALAFSFGMTEMGGTYFLQRFDESNFAVGETRDEIRYVSDNVDLIVVRMKEYSTVCEMAEFSTVPVINGCCNRFHPSQALADALTIKELCPTRVPRILYVGVWNNVLNSLVLVLGRLGYQLDIAAPEINPGAHDPLISNLVRDLSNVNVLPVAGKGPEDFRTEVQEADFIYTDTWVDMEHFRTSSGSDLMTQRSRNLESWKLSSDLLRGSCARVLHDMPIHPGFEITREIVEEHFGTILQQSQNRRHVAKAMLLHAYLKAQ